MINYNIHWKDHIEYHKSEDQGSVEQLLTLARNVAVDALKKSNKSHAIYGIKYYDPVYRIPKIVDIYNPAILLDDEEFTERVDAQHKYFPDSHIVAAHSNI